MGIYLTVASVAILLCWTQQPFAFYSTQRCGITGFDIGVNVKFMDLVCPERVD